MFFRVGDRVKVTPEHARAMFRADRPNRERYMNQRGVLISVDARSGTIRWDDGREEADLLENLEKAV